MRGGPHCVPAPASNIAGIRAPRIVVCRRACMGIFQISDLQKVCIRNDLSTAGDFDTHTRERVACVHLLWIAVCNALTFFCFVSIFEMLYFIWYYEAFVLF
jgi:hypothetical protein